VVAPDDSATAAAAGGLPLPARAHWLADLAMRSCVAAFGHSAEAVRSKGLLLLRGLLVQHAYDAR
jgi:hypothetical protein